MKLDSDLTTDTTITPTAPLLSAYTDFRVYLRDFYKFKRRTLSNRVRPYTYAAFSAGANIKSPNYLKMIIEGQRNLSPEMVGKFAKALGLSKEETEEFRALVEYGQAKDPLERNRFLKALAHLRVGRQMKAGAINEQTWEKVPNWITWVLYSMVDQSGVRFELSSLLDLMRGRASLDEIKRSLEGLMSSGELQQNPESGEITKGRALMEGSEHIPVEMVRKLQAELIYLGLESLFQDEATEREFGAMTAALTKEEFEGLKFELRQLRKRWSKDFSVNREKSKGERVYQLNIQLFPVTNKSS